ncbi:MAG TPA: phosphatase PAP2 family protein [Mucilaginibacter sp.]|nr:phosphatase PAP2 family protein [Mucilaginibacter sp.]
MKQSLNEVLRRVKWLIIPYLPILCACLIIKLTFSRETIYFTVNGINSPVMDFLAPFATDLGNGWTAIIIGLIWLMFSYRKGFIILTAYGVTSITAQILKYIFDAPRPKLYFKDQLSRIHFIKEIDMLSLHSFPSGHTVSAFTLAVIFTYWSRNKAWGPVFLLLAVLIGYSRMYLSQHFFEDVTAGSVIGVIVTIIWLYWLDNRAFIQKPGWQKGLLN